MGCHRCPKDLPTASIRCRKTLVEMQKPNPVGEAVIYTIALAFGLFALLAVSGVLS